MRSAVLFALIAACLCDVAWAQQSTRPQPSMGLTPLKSVECALLRERPGGSYVALRPLTIRDGWNGTWTFQAGDVINEGAVTHGIPLPNLIAQKCRGGL